MRRADVRERLENVGVRFKAAPGNFALREEREAMIDHIVGENAAVGVLRWYRGIIAQHVGQDAVLVDRGDCFLARVVARMPHQVDELIEPALAIVDRLAGVVFLFGVVGVEEAADARVARAIDMEELAVAPHAASSLSGLAPSSLVGSSITVENTFACVFESTPVHGDLPPR